METKDSAIIKAIIEEQFTARDRRINDRFDKYMESTNEKLDVLIELNQKMAVVYERQQRSIEDMIRVEKMVAENRKQVSDEFKEVEIKICDAIKERNFIIDNSEAKLKEEIGKTTGNLKIIEDDYKENKNFVKGAVWLAGIIFFVVQGLIVKYFKDINDEIRLTKEEIRKVAEKQIDTDNQFKLFQYKWEQTKTN